MKNVFIKSMAVLMVSTVFVSADTTTLNPTDDAFIASNAPDDNFGGLTNLYVGYWVGGYLSSLINFDLSPYAGSTIDGAYLRLFVYHGEGTFPPTNIKLGRNTADWSEDTVTWNNRPGYTDYYVIDSPVTENAWWVTEVTDYIQGFVGGSYANYGFRVGKGDTDESAIYVRSKEFSGPTYHPELLIYYTPNSVESESLGSIKAAFK